MNPPGSEDHFGHEKIYSGANDWNKKSNRFSCSFQLGDKMFIVGGEGSYGYDSYQLQFAPPQWIAKLEKLPNLPIRFEEGSCYAYTSTDAMICSSKYYDGTTNAGRECYHTSDGITYKPIEYLAVDHQGGKMVRAPVSGQDSVLMIGGRSTGNMEEYCSHSSCAKQGWSIRQNFSHLAGVIGFSAIYVPYKHTFADYQIYIVGGHNIITDTPNLDITYWHSPSSNYFSVMPMSDRLLTHRYNHATIQIDNLIYFIGGFEFKNNNVVPGGVEVWELKWDHDPGYYPSGYGACLQWCYWNDIEGLQERPGGLCKSAWWDLIIFGSSQCTYYQDTPQFYKRVVTSTAHGGILDGDHLKAFVMP